MTQTKTSHEDLRIRRTYKLLIEALLSLLEEKPFDDISVIEICDRAMIHRTTFYKHFEDKYHLMRFGVQTLTESVNAASQPVYDDENPRAYYLDLIRRHLRFNAQHKRMILLLARSKSDVLDVIREFTSKNIEEKLKRREKKNGSSFPVPASVLAEYFTGALNSLTLWWLQNSMPYTEEQLLSYVDVLMCEPDRFKRAFLSENTDSDHRAKDVESDIA